MFLSPFSTAITSLGEERANLSAFRTFVRFVLVWICRFPLPFGVLEELRFVIVAVPGLFSYPFLYYLRQKLLLQQGRVQHPLLECPELARERACGAKLVPIVISTICLYNLAPNLIYLLHDRCLSRNTDALQSLTDRNVL